jgi:hypothetical protein
MATISKEGLGLDQVDNTSDINKPVSISQKRAINDSITLIMEAISKYITVNDFDLPLKFTDNQSNEYKWDYDILSDLMSGDKSYSRSEDIR